MIICHGSSLKRDQTYGPKCDFLIDAQVLSSVCVCVCVCVRERVFVCVCVRERERERECVCVCA